MERLQVALEKARAQRNDAPAEKTPAPEAAEAQVETQAETQAETLAVRRKTAGMATVSIDSDRHSTPSPC